MCALDKQKSHASPAFLSAGAVATSLRAVEPNSWPHFFLLPSAIPCLQWFPLPHSSMSEDHVPFFLELGCWWESLLQGREGAEGPVLSTELCAKVEESRSLKPAAPVQYPMNIFGVCWLFFSAR